LHPHPHPHSYSLVQDVNGLSTYVDWLSDVLARPRTIKALKKSELEILQQQVREGREYLARNPLKKAQQKEKKDEIEKALAAIVTQKHILYQDCFPNRLLIHQYVEDMHRTGELSAKLYKKYWKKEKRKLRVLLTSRIAFRPISPHCIAPHRTASYRIA